MANKINVKLILQLRDAGLSRNSIASTRHISRHSVSDVLYIADRKGISYADISNLDDNQVYRMFYPDKYSEETMYRDPDYEYVHRELRKVGVTLKLLWQEYKDKCESFAAVLTTRRVAQTMLNDETRRKLRQMNIGENIEAIELQEQDPQTMALPFEQRFQQLTDSVDQQKYDTKVRKLIKSAKFRLPQADIHDAFYHEKRSVNRNVINELGACRFVEDNRSVILQEYTSSGKTYLACALGKEACHRHYTTRYIRESDLLSEFDDKSLLPGGAKKLLMKYSNFRVLILDEWLTGDDMSKEELSFLFELSERRFDCTSTIFCSLSHKEEWVKRLGGGRFAESIAERYRYNTTVVETVQMNMREVFDLRCYSYGIIKMAFDIKF